ncbi:hypothetical protein GA0070620_4608 [Micromonospora krabiensis]|uniref:Uncharacterized protein n=1 Tax=Micromonospora krabiensis TaxID=307121 RepID=A0A1C3N929_9ACTN|nr:hypothetical protein GA0070620_4608 [Micromonospora krabiensis]
MSPRLRLGPPGSADGYPARSGESGTVEAGTVEPLAGESFAGESFAGESGPRRGRTS